MKIGLSETLAQIREELSKAVAEANDAFRFPIKEVSLTFQVGVTKGVSADGRAQLWVLEL